MIGGTATTQPGERTLRRLLRRYRDAGAPLALEPVAEGLLNRGYRLATTHGRYFLKQYVEPATADRAVIIRQHRTTRLLGDLGLPVAPPVPDADGRTVAEVAGCRYALYPWVEGRHRVGADLSAGQSRRLGALLGAVHRRLAEVQPAPVRQCPGDHASADPDETYALIDALLALARARQPRSTFDLLAEHRLRERRALLERHAHRRPPAPDPPATGWVHGDFHPLNLLYRGAEPVAIVDWDRLGVQPRAEEAVRAGAIFFVQPGGMLDLSKVRSYARAYRRAAGASAQELAAAVHRVWWERLNDFWMLRWRYQRDDRRADPLFPAASALVVWWTRSYEAVLRAYTA